ncbi:MAG TPA: hypothetical protein VLN45_05605 [Ignavibacteriaceae bacterium]|nr:hypothetical protein [Ignavibacteriaceae bacterium]
MCNSIFAQDNISEKGFIFSPSFAGAQAEFSTLLYVWEFGGLIDIDFFKKESEKITYSFSTRISFESYDYLELGGTTGGGPFKDFCFFLMHSSRSEKFHVNLFGGIAYHTKASSFYSDETLFRVGFELRYNLPLKIIGIILKGSTSIEDRTSFIGLGVAFGYYH